MRAKNLYAIFVTALIAAPTMARAEIWNVPNGTWGMANTGKPDCKSPIVKTEPTKITFYFEGGKGVCSFQTPKKKGKILFSKAINCKWDAGVSEADKEGGEDGDNSFSVKMLSPRAILFNNSELQLCGG